MQKKEKNLTISQEEIESNHIVKSTKSYLIVFSILFLSILLLLVGSLFRTNITPDYPIVFKGADNRLMVITRNNDVNDITNIEETDIVYANSDVRYILYTDKNTKDDFENIDVVKYHENLLFEISNYNALLFYPNDFVEIINTLEQALTILKSDEFDFQRYKKLVFDAGALIQRSKVGDE